MSDDPSGFVVVDKPAGMTSHDVVGRCRRIFGMKRVGHAGTLDPDATGVLIVAVGRATRLIRFVSEQRKTYKCEVVLGAATNTLDDSGETTQTWDMSSVTLEDMRNVAQKFMGDIEQIPPMVSAIKIDGRRLHELAREGLEVERKARPVTVYAMRIDTGDEASVFRMEVKCSAGTYVRTLAADIGDALGGGAHLRNLRRTKIGEFGSSAESMYTLEQLEAAGRGALQPPALMVRHLRPVVLHDDDAIRGVTHGRPLSRQRCGLDDIGPWSVMDKTGALLGVYEAAGEDGMRGAVVMAGK